MHDNHVVIFPSGYPTPHAPVSGIFFLEQARALQEAGVNVGVVYPDLRSLRDLSPSALLENRFQVTEAVEQGVQTLRCHGWNVPKTSWRMQLYVTLFRRLMRRYVKTYGRPDVIHAHSVLWAGHAARVVSQEMNIPLVITEHSTAFARGLYGPWEQDLIRDALHAAAATIAVSRALADELAPFVPAERLHVVPNMVDTDRFTLPKTLREPSPFTFLNVALLTPKKGVDVLLRAFTKAFKGKKDVRLEVGGDGPQRAELEALARRLGIDGHVEFLGRLSRDEVRDRLWAANCFSLASHVETFGVVVIEAMATGLPVVATHCGGPEELVTEESGWIVEPGDVDALAEGMRTAYHARNTLSQRTEAIRNVVLQTYAQPVVAEQIIGVYQESAF